MYFIKILLAKASMPNAIKKGRRPCLQIIVLLIPRRRTPKLVRYRVTRRHHAVLRQMGIFFGDLAAAVSQHSLHVI